MSKKWLLLLPVIALIAVAVYASTTYAGVGANVNFISGTEYQQGEIGQVIVRATDAWGNPITADWCNTTIYNPDKTVLVNNTAMTQGGSPGSWYYGFTTPFTQIGVYEEYVKCQVTLPAGVRTLGAGSSFHVSQTLTMLNETASAQIRIVS
jgi:hypothetical protein